ncbi:disulfide bond formation protein B [Pseudorhodobacter sp.]|uniref:disulfide bond formation protein B n=1 Tax=Pseudorhodobacter sp. TaxID=1934400 RepID=UPI0026474863|nr:disulfide bond formation protein B [Pseudorhodobacter sp.]MDN5788553.1 disulfide bond formation protein B [Pseudorhodobacter sp.]
MTRQSLILLAMLGSAALLLGAYGFQYIGGMRPCELCWWQRYPHMVAVVIGLLALILHGRTLPYLGALTALTSAGIALFHTGVERAWWKGLESCSGGSIANISVADLLNPAANVAAPIRCDSVAWEMFGLSMASWNGILSIVLVLIWLSAAAKPRD